MRRTTANSRFAALAATVVFVLAACGGDDEGDDATSSTPEAAATEPAATEPAATEPAATEPATTEPLTTEPADTTPAAAAGPVSLALADTGLGEVVVDGAGMTLYAFAIDEGGTSACYDDCAVAWPPLLVESLDAVEFGDGLDPGLFSTTERDDGTVQLVMGDWPLYYWQNDEAPGDTNGQAVNDVWWVVDASGALITTAPADTGAPDGTSMPEDGAAAPIVEVAGSELGDILVGADGMTLYAFLADEGGTSTCYDECAENWPPVLVDGDVGVGEGLDASIFSTVERDDGSKQLVAGGYPLYGWVNDGEPGDTTGQGVNDVWYVVGPDGQPVTETSASTDGGYGYGVAPAASNS